MENVKSYTITYIEIHNLTLEINVGMLISSGMMASLTVVCVSVVVCPSVSVDDCRLNKNLV